MKQSPVLRSEPTLSTIYSPDQLSFAAEAIGSLILPLKVKFEEHAGGANLPIRKISSLIGLCDNSQ